MTRLLRCRQSVRAWMLVHVLLLLLLSAASRCIVGAETTNERIERIEHGLVPAALIRGQPARTMTISERMAFHRVPGVSVAVIDKWQIDWARGYGLVEAGGTQPVTPDTLFQAASISKPVAAMAAIALVQRGKLSLDENVNSRLVSWKVPDNEFTKDQKVTLRRLLSHNAGLTVHGFPGYAADERLPTLVELLNGKNPANTKPISPDTVPGTELRYSGGGYCLLQQLMMDVTRKSFPDILQEIVFGPLRMSHSSYVQPLPSSRSGAAAVAHNSRGEPIKGKWHTYPEKAAAGLWTTPSDLARFAVELRKCRTGKSSRVLSTALAQQMLTPQMEETGLGIFMGGSGQTWRFMHGGANEGFRAVLVAYAETGWGAVIMANSDSGDALYEEILRSIARE